MPLGKWSLTSENNVKEVVYYIVYKQVIWNKSEGTKGEIGWYSTVQIIAQK